jgi:hypothetical protein
MTTVINIKDAPEGWKNNQEYVYIGMEGRGFDGYFGNPFLLYDEKERLDILEQYKEWFLISLSKSKVFKNKILKLKDKTLVCFCSPKPCHGDIIAEYLNNEIR